MTWFVQNKIQPIFGFYEVGKFLGTHLRKAMRWHIKIVLHDRYFFGRYINWNQYIFSSNARMVNKIFCWYMSLQNQVHTLASIYDSAV